jgi:glyoxylase-like metal-dependent hydrolase (beta-lactamase superfamily II)
MLLAKIGKKKTWIRFNLASGNKVKKEIHMKKLLTSVLISSLSLLSLSVAKADDKEKVQIIEFKSGGEGFDTKTFFYVTPNEVVAIDAQFTPKLAEDSIKYLRTFTDRPITTLIITHPNPDKFNGASVFKKLGATIISSKATSEAIPFVHQYKKYYFVEIAKMFTNENYPELTPIDSIFVGEKTITLANKDVLVLKELKEPGVSSTQTVVFAKNKNALFVGDLIHHNAHAWIEGGIVAGKPVPTIDGWIADLKELESIYPSDVLVYGGRGITAPLEIVARDQINYLQKSIKIIRAEIAKFNMTKKDLGTEMEKAFYTNLEKCFVREFPDYKLPYMIAYGSYGLFQSLLK